MVYVAVHKVFVWTISSLGASVPTGTPVPLKDLLFVRNFPALFVRMTLSLDAVLMKKRGPWMVQTWVLFA